ncbi:MAG TPA: TRAP transporter substrate-binding protein DctP [Polyangia bacterium]|nr:TRAP transporter substrate-binding protein DctP [Polyangia bacterium]
MKRILAALFVLTLAAGAARADETFVFKIATLAPEGSSWMNLFHTWGKAVEEHSAGKIKVKFYPGGVAGDERDAVRKMRLGQINGAAVTAIGLGLIQSEIRVLELPLMIRDYAELDYIRNKFSDEIRKKFEEKGYVLLAWGDVGPVHIFSNIEIKSKADLKQTKLWAWVDDPLVRALFQQLGANGVPLGVPDVLPSLQTGLINACYGSPLSTLALQWYTKVKYMTRLHISQAIGATVVTKKDFDRLTPDLQKVLLTDSHELEVKVLKQIREDNEKALVSMKQAGLTVVESPKDMVDDFTAQAQAIRAKLEPSVYSHEWREKVEKALADYRAGHK